MLHLNAYLMKPVILQSCKHSSKLIRGFSPFHTKSKLCIQVKNNNMLLKSGAIGSTMASNLTRPRPVGFLLVSMINFSWEFSVAHVKMIYLKAVLGLTITQDDANVQVSLKIK